MAKNKKIGFFLIFNYLLLILLPILILYIFVVNVINTNLSDEITNKNELISKSLSIKVTKELSDIEHHLKNLGLLLNVEQINDKTQNDIFNSYIKTNLDFESIEVLDSKGKIIFTAPFKNELIRIDRSNSDYFNFLSKNKEKVYWSNTFVSNFTFQPSLIVGINTAEHYIIGYVNLKNITDISDYIKSLSKSKIFISITDIDGVYISHDDRNKVLQRESEPYFKELIKRKEKQFFYDYNNLYSLINISKIEKSGWYVIIRQKYDDAFAIVKNINNIFLILAFLVIISTIVFTINRTEKLLRPFRMLINKFNEVSEGDYNTSIDYKGFYEYEQLTDDFNIMVEKIRIREQELKETKEILDIKYKEVLAADRAKNEFLANMSHEIRTPLNGIVGSVELFRLTQLDEEQLEYLKIMEFSSERIVAVISDLLDISRIEAGKVRLDEREFELYPLIEKIIDTFSFSANGKGLELVSNVHHEVNNYLIGDKDRIAQILINLMSNALKFTERGQVELEVKKISENEETVKIEFTVKDTGIGIAEDQFDEIFKRFYQVDYSDTRKYGGMGIGLSIVKKLVELMNGEIHVNSIEGIGSKFWFYLELKKNKNKSDTADYISEIPELKNKKIMIIDDNYNNRIILENTVEKWGGEYISFGNGKDAIDYLRQHEDTNLIILDYLMPEMSGLDFIKQSYEMISEQRIPVIVLTSSYSIEIREEFRKYEVDDFITKPVKINELYHNILKITRKKKNEMNLNYEIKKEKNGDSIILLVEDNEINRKTTKLILEKRNLEVITCENGEKAVRLFSENNIKLILMDVEMPVMNGLEAAKAIRKMEKGEDIPIIAVTAYVSSEEKKRCIDAGMNDYIAKPYKPEELNNKIDKYL